MAMFDTHRAVKKLTGAGFSEFQAEALIDAVGDEHEALATKADLLAARADLRGIISALRTELKEDVAALLAELTGEIASARAETNTIRSEMQALELRMTMRLGGLVVAGVAVLAVLELIP
jgi:predicted  nucleic acid-binding Zn-ribbon protein